METVFLDPQFKPLGQYDLIRLGRDYDGGYLIDKNSVESTDILVSLGVYDDWSFEADFINLNDIPIEAFDASINMKVLAKMLVKSALKPYRLSHLLHSFRALLGYRRFFRGNKRHHELLVGYDKEPRFISMAKIIEDYVLPKYQNIFLKIDIEGWEYRILDHLVDYSSYINGLVIEFHHFDLHQNRIKHFVNNMGMNICHVHCNMAGPVNDKHCPLTVEMSFTKGIPEVDSEVSLPHALDRPNGKGLEDYVIYFK